MLWPRGLPLLTPVLFATRKMWICYWKNAAWSGRRTLWPVRDLCFVMRLVLTFSWMGRMLGPGDALHIVFSDSRIRPEYQLPAPSLLERERLDQFYVLKLEALVRMKLTSFRRKDQVHLLDLLDVGLIDQQWLERFPPLLAGRLQELIENPDS